jgi:2-aminoethylphosphonate-pyruvate transaminase
VPLLLTPGPLTTSESTRRALRSDHGSRDPAFLELVGRVRTALTRLIDPTDAWTCVPMQGSGTFAVEAMLTTLLPHVGAVLVPTNGAYGDRLAAIVRRSGRAVHVSRFDEVRPVDPDVVDAELASRPGVTHVAMVYSETTTGLVNPLAEVAAVAARRGVRLLVDAMSAFGALPLDGREPIDGVAASSNKCLEGVPGLGFVLARRSALEGCAGRASTVSLDLHEQSRRLDQDGQFRFTPPTHVMAALDAAIAQHAAEGGVAARGARYARNRDVLVDGLRDLGLAPLLDASVQGPIIVTVRAPSHPAWSFSAFYDALLDRGFAIYPGKLTVEETFRVGVIGQVFEADVRRFLVAVRDVLNVMGIAPLGPA